MDAPTTIAQLVTWMQSNCYHFNNYSIGGNIIHEGHGIQQQDSKFSWYYTERGQINLLKHLHTEREVVEYAWQQIKDDRWARTHCIGFVFVKALNDELASILDNTGIGYTQDKIPYNGPDQPAFRTFVYGCDIRKTAHLRQQYFHAV